MSESIPAAVPALTRWQSAGWAAAGLTAFHVAYFWEPAGILVAVYLAAMFYLPRLPSRRWAFYAGFLFGYAVGVPHLWFLFGIFGWGAIGLWGVFALWFGFYLLLGRMILDRWPRSGGWLLPFLWFGLEFFRSELYPLRFSWLIPGFALSDPRWSGLAMVGVYGFSFLVLLAIAVFDRLPSRWGVLWLAACLAAGAGICTFPVQNEPADGPLVVGMQMESPTETQVLAGLDLMIRKSPDADLLLLSEYTFDGPIPESVLAWCAFHKKYLMAGGRDPLADSEEFYDTIFVVSPEGKIVFRQAKAQPIPFFNDGLPAETQQVWESPWGRLGVGICYDLSYSRLMDPLIRQDADALIIPAVDVITWGEWEHELHAKLVPVRAREYGIPVFRLASSGISTFAGGAGRIAAEGRYPGHDDILAARLPMHQTGRLPADRYVAFPVVAGVGVLLIVLLFTRKKKPGG